MQFDFDVARACGEPSAGGHPAVVCVEEASLRHPRWGEGLRDVLDAVGERSRVAQGLGKAVTAGRSALLAGNNVYLMVAGQTVLGLLKTGPKKLFVVKSSNDGLVEINPQCVLDFYIVEGKQRAGLGRSLFETMLEREDVTPEKLAYDRPSPKLLGFLQKHFGLSRYAAQNNNFVVFDAYFESQRRRSSNCRPSPPCSSLASEPVAKCRTDTRDLNSGRRHARGQDVQHRPTNATVAAAAVAAAQRCQDDRDEATAAGMPSGGNRRTSCGAAYMASRRSGGSDCSASSLHHAIRSGLQPAHLPN